MHSVIKNHWNKHSYCPLVEKIVQEPGRNTDVVKSYSVNDFVQIWVFKGALKELDEEAHRQVSGSEFHSRGAE